MSFVSAALRRGLLRASSTATAAVTRTGARQLRAASASRRCFCAAAAPEGGDASEKPRYARRPMKRFFAAYDEKFDARLAELEQERRDNMLNWDYVASAFYERPQIILEDLHPIEEEFYAAKELIHDKYMVPFEGFMAGEEQIMQSLAAAKRLVKEQEERQAAGEVVDPEDMRNEVYMQYAGSDVGERIIEQYDKLTRIPNPRKTQADHDEDVQSLNRRLDTQLFLILKKDRDNHEWQFPQAVHVDADPADYPNQNMMPGLRETAEKAVASGAGKAMKGYYYSHAPQGFYYYKYPDGPKNGSIGAKVFYYRVRYLKGRPKPSGDYVDYRWVTREELADYFDEETFTFMRQMV